MRRILITLVMSAAVVVAVPGAAMAQHHARHHARHHATRHARRHHRSHRRSRIRHERFGSWDQGGSGQAAGTVTSFTDNGDGTGVLTITLNDGSMVTGNVTSSTELECTSSNQQGEDNGGDNGTSGDSGDNSNGGDDSANSGDNGPNADNSGEDQGDNNTGEDQGDNNTGEDNGGSEDNGGQMCSTAALTPNTPVADASLEITSSGSNWDKVELITS